MDVSRLVFPRHILFISIFHQYLIWDFGPSRIIKGKGKSVLGVEATSTNPPSYHSKTISQKLVEDHASLERSHVGFRKHQNRFCRPVLRVKSWRVHAMKFVETHICLYLKPIFSHSFEGTA